MDDKSHRKQKGPEIITVRADSQGFVRAQDLPYERPSQGTRQDQFTKKDIKQKLRGYMKISAEELVEVKYSTWIKYIDNKTGLFRVGGILSKVSPPDYIVLKNPYNKMSWSVQMKSNTFYIPDPSVNQKKEELEQQKEEVFKLYQKGLLRDSRMR